MFSPGQLSQILHQAPLQKPSGDDTTVNINETTKKKTTTRRDNEMKSTEREIPVPDVFPFLL